MDKYIKQSAAHKAAVDFIKPISPVVIEALRQTLDNIPAEDVVARDCYDRILSENDIMRGQLAEIGKGIGDKMDDVATVVHGKWISQIYAKYECSQCGFYEINEDYPFCPFCGAKMDL